MLGLVREDPTAAGSAQNPSQEQFVSSSQNGKSTLLVWLNLLGWQVDVERDGANLVGVARHCAGDGRTFRVGGCARTRDELAYQLFDAAMKIVEARGERLRRPLLAA